MKEQKQEHAKKFSARLCAVQALYQVSQNKQSLRAVYEEYLQFRSDMTLDEGKLAPPDGALLKKILFGVEERLPELEAMIGANLRQEASQRAIEPLLKAILLSAAYELLVRDFDAPIIINDYLDVTHAFYGKGEVGLVNGVLDSIASVLQ